MPSLSSSRVCTRHSAAVVTVGRPLLHRNPPALTAASLTSLTQPGASSCDIWQGLETFLMISTWGGGGYCHLVWRDQRCCSTPYNAQLPPQRIIWSETLRNPCLPQRLTESEGEPEVKKERLGDRIWGQLGLSYSPGSESPRPHPQRQAPARPGCPQPRV